MSSVYKMESEFHKTSLAKGKMKIVQVSEMLKGIELCPRSADEVYSMGIKIQGFISSIIENYSQTENKKQEAVKRQLVIKNRIRQLADFNLNQLLDYFYSNGGPVIDPPVSEQSARDIQPFYSRIAVNALTQMVEAAEQCQEAGTQECEADITDIVVSMYEAMAKQYGQINEIKTAFAELKELQGI